MTQNPIPKQYPPEKLRKYPHMGPKDVAIWERFLDSTQLPNALVAYDVHVGSTPKLKPGDPDWLRKHIEAVYPKKIDAVLYFPTETLVCEIKPFAGLTAIGQALGGCQLFKDQYPDAPTPKPVIITDKAQPDIPSICTTFGIILLEDLPSAQPAPTDQSPLQRAPHNARTTECTSHRQKISGTHT